MPELLADSTMFLLSPTLHIALLPDCQTCQTATPSPPPPKTLLRTERGSCAEVTALHKLSISSTVWSHSSSCKYEAFQIHLLTPTCLLHHCFRKTQETSMISEFLPQLCKVLTPFVNFCFQNIIVALLS